MSGPDLTRWNRAGLRRIHYVQGNAAAYLEKLREALAARFPQRWGKQLQAPPSGEEMERDDEWVQARRNQHLTAQYQAERGDIAWEIARTFARACHVLTGHIDAHANEAYLRTATQWESVRRLVDTLDYHPPGATSASTYLVLEARPGAKGVVNQGLAVRYCPPGGGAPVIFETLEDVQIDAAQNALRPVEHDRCPEPLLGEDQGAAEAGWRVPKKPGIVEGEAAIVTGVDKDGSQESIAVGMDKVDRSTDQLTLSDPDLWGDLQRGSARLQVAPRWKRRPWLNGRGVVRTNRPHGFAAGNVVAWQGNGPSGWWFAEVADAGAYALRFDLQRWPFNGADGNLPAAGQPLFRACVLLSPKVLSEYIAAVMSDGTPVTHIGVNPNLKEFATQDLNGGEEEPAGPGINSLMDVPAIAWKAVLWAVGATLKDLVKIPSTQETIPQALLSLGNLLASSGGNADEPEAGYERSSGESAPAALFYVSAASRLPTGDLAVIAPTLWVLFPTSPAADPPKVVAVDDARRYVFQGSPRGLASGRLAAARFKTAGGSKWTAVRIASVEEPVVLDPAQATPAAFAVTIAGVPDEVKKDGELLELHASFDPTLLAPVGADANPTPANASLTLRADHGLRPGQKVLVTAGAEARLAAIAMVDGAMVGLSPPLPATFTLGKVVLHGNVVRASHGERRPDRYLSGGSASRPVQQLTLDVGEVSTIADPTVPRGMRPDVEILIGAEQWQHVARLGDSEPGAPHFATRTTAEGHLQVLFGDGRHGRQLPAGTNNVQVRYRQGAGRRGLLGPGRLVEPAQPHPLVERVLQPLATQAGEDVQPRARIRKQAPAAVMALDRAVSAVDFEHVAQDCPDVVQARAQYVPAGAGHQDSVRVVVVLAGGVDIAGTDPRLQDLGAYLQERSLPTARVAVVSFARQVVPLAIEIRVDFDRFDPDRVAQSVKEHLLAEFSAERRRIGQTLFLSEVYAAVESVTGVEDAHGWFFVPPRRADAVAATSARPNDSWLGDPVEDPGRVVLVLAEDHLPLPQYTRYLP